jgi:hypothetical protein
LSTHRRHNDPYYSPAIQCTARWIWSGCTNLRDGDTFPATIRGNQMILEAHRGGNQGKLIHARYRIMDIRSLEPPIQ